MASGNPRKATADDRKIVALFAGLDTGCVSDALDKLGLHGQVVGVRALADYAKPIVGPAFTVKYVPASVPPGTVGDYLDDVAEGDVVVIDNDGRTDCSVWGEITTQYAALRAIAAAVIDGACRDVSKALQSGYPMFTAGRVMRTGKDRVQVESVGTTISVGTVRVASRDIVVADASGVVVVPRARVSEVVFLARQIEAAEAAIAERLENGETITEARAALKYHTLQSKT
jgi:regulator of RNase E activity RraA